MSSPVLWRAPVGVVRACVCVVCGCVWVWVCVGVGVGVGGWWGMQEPENNTMGEQEALPATVPASDSDAEFHGARRRRNKVDSFVHMMRSMQRTANRRTEDEASLFG